MHKSLTDVMHIFIDLYDYTVEMGFLCLSFQTGLPQTQTDETTVLQYHTHPFVWFRATEFLRFFSHRDRISTHLAIALESR